VLTERGVADYPLEQCRDDYGMALLLPASRLATAVGIHPGLTATPDGRWNIVFPRYARALTDLGVKRAPRAALRLVRCGCAVRSCCSVDTRACPASSSFILPAMTQQAANVKA
jgi:hypothetical protein